MSSWTELDLTGKANLAWAAAGIAVCALVAYATVRQVRMQRKLERRMHLDEEDL
jgi:hypothetical protein